MSGTLGQLLRFGAVGIVVNATLFAAYLVIVAWGVEPKGAVTITYALGLGVGFGLHRRWTYASKGRSPRELARYVIVSLAGYGLNLLVLAVCVDGLAWPHAWVQGSVVLVVAASTFALNKVWVFDRPGR